MFLIDEIKRQFQKPNNAVIKLMTINLIVFFVLRLISVIMELFFLKEGWSFLSPYITLSSVPLEFLKHPWTIFTTMFTHWDLGHIFFNMLGLYFIGNFFQSEFGDKRLVAVYILTGLGANVLYFALQQIVPFYLQNQSALLGASGAIVGVFIAIATIYPNKEISLLFLPMIRFKIKWMAIVMVLIYIIGLTGGNGGGDLCHLGGAAMGFLYAKLLQQGTDLAVPVLKVLTFFELLFKQSSKPKMNVSHSNYKNANKSNIQDVDYTEISMDDIDVILDKLKVSGYSSLSKEEKRILFEYSKQ